MFHQQEGNATTNAILVILLVVIVVFGVWYAMSSRRAVAPADDRGPGLQIDITGGSGDDRGGSGSESSN